MCFYGLWEIYIFQTSHIHDLIIVMTACAKTSTLFGRAWYRELVNIMYHEVTIQISWGFWVKIILPLDWIPTKVNGISLSYFLTHSLGRVNKFMNNDRNELGMRNSKADFGFQLSSLHLGMICIHLFIST